MLSCQAYWFNHKDNNFTVEKQGDTTCDDEFSVNLAGSWGARYLVKPYSECVKGILDEMNIWTGRHVKYSALLNVGEPHLIS